MNTLKNWANKGFVILSLIAVVTLSSCEQEVIEPDFVSTGKAVNVELLTTNGDDNPPPPPCSGCDENDQ